IVFNASSGPSGPWVQWAIAGSDTSFVALASNATHLYAMKNDGFLDRTPLSAASWTSALGPVGPDFSWVDVHSPFKLDSAPYLIQPLPADRIVTVNSSASITWTIGDDWGSGTYQVLINGTSWTSGSWSNNTPFSVSVNSSDVVGVYNYTLIFTDTGGHGGTDEVLVTLQDLAPTCNRPSDIIIDVNTAGVTITWILYDDVNGSHYRVLSNTSGSLTVIINWNTWTNITTVIVSVSTTTIGTFLYRIEFNDSAGQSSIHDVLVTVQQPQQPSNPTPVVPGFELAFTILALIALVGVAISFRKRSLIKT
ncbi:MAG: hypothetical protein ACXQS8_01580, partial [Candidatus Helarchaeales archaeon]